MKEKSHKKVLVCYLGRRGAGPVYAYEMTKSLLENGCEVYAIISEYIENKPLWEALPFKHLYVYSTYNSTKECVLHSLKFYFFQGKELEKELEKIHLDVIYMPMLHVWNVFFCTKLPFVKKIFTVHDPVIHENNRKVIYFLEKYINWRCIKSADAVVILSKLFKDYVVNHFNVEKEKIYWIPHGRFDYYDKDIQRKEDIIEYDGIQFLFFGRIEKYKGLEILAQAYRLLSEKNLNVTLTIAGEGDFSPYEKMYDGLNNVTIVNRWIREDEVQDFFRRKKVVTVLPYLSATQSGVIPIAMHFKSLVIASDVGGLSEQIENGSTGYLIEKGNVDALYRRMQFVCENYDLTYKIRENANEKIKELSWGNLGKKLIRIMDDICS